MKLDFNQPAAVVAVLLALSGCSGVTHQGKKAPACSGPLTLLNPEEHELWPNTFNDQHQGVRPGAVR